MNVKPLNPSRKVKSIVGAILFLMVFLAIAYLFRTPLFSAISNGYQYVCDRRNVEQFISSFGKGAPVVFMGIQVLQVILAPIPGEATGFIGGFLFGTLNGFVYSSIALSVGSWLNFLIGRFVGKRYVRKLIPDKTLEKFDRLIRRQGIIALAVLFVFPGFPKDYLCLFLGISTIPLKAFLLIASIGRMPGTFLLSLQGDSVFNRNYLVSGLVFIIMAAIVLVGFRYREAVYNWIEKMNNKK